jgi:hypothetical protein
MDCLVKVRICCTGIDKYDGGRSLPHNPRPASGVKGHNMNETSFAHILLATACPGSPSLWAGSWGGYGQAIQY